MTRLLKISITNDGRSGLLTGYWKYSWRCNDEVPAFKKKFRLVRITRKGIEFHYVYVDRSQARPVVKSRITHILRWQYD